MTENHTQDQSSVRRQVLAVIVLFGIISMLGDVVHESARSVNGQYLSLLGVTAAKVGLVFGLGEFIGYALRLISGVILDKSGKYWLFLFLGYGVHFVIPLMGCTTSWGVLIVLILTERIGKAFRSPAKDTLLSGISERQVGLGFAFGLQEALDQLGAFLGPLIFTAVFYYAGQSGVGEFQLGYRLLAIPFVVLMLFLVYAWRRVSRLEREHGAVAPVGEPQRLSRMFWIYSAFTFFTAFGLLNFGIIGYHLKVRSIMSDTMITMLYAGAMGIDALVALLIGRTYDRLKERTGSKTGGILVLLIVPLLTLLLPILTLSTSVPVVISGMVVMGVILGAHETVMRSAIADLTPYKKRGLGFGLFNTFYGLALLAGSALSGLLYDRGLTMVIILLTALSEGIALFFYWIMYRKVRATAQ